MSAQRETETVAREALTLKEAAKSIGVSLNTFRRHVLPTIKAVRLGSAIVIQPSELASWLERHGTLNTRYT